MFSSLRRKFSSSGVYPYGKPQPWLVDQSEVKPFFKPLLAQQDICFWGKKEKHVDIKNIFKETGEMAEW